MWIAAAALFFIQAANPEAAGLKALEDHQYEAAVEQFRKAIEADPSDYSAHFNLAMAYGFLNRDAEGIAEYKKTLELKPGLFQAETNEGLLLLRQKNAAAALPLYEEAAAQKPRDFGARYHLGQCQLETGDAGKAGENFRAALEINPKSAGAELGLAHALVAQQKLSDAAPHFQEAAKIDPAYRDGLLELADLYEKNHQAPEAIALLKQFPDNPAAQEHLGALMLRNRQYAEAIPSLEQAYAKDPTPANRAALGLTYQANGDTAKALPLLEKAAAENSADFGVQFTYGQALLETKQYPAAVRQFNQTVKIKPDDMRAWSNLGAALYLAGELEHAVGAFDRARQLGENTAGNWFMRAITLDKLRQLKPALEAYQQFLSMSHGENENQEFQARQRSKIIQRELEKH
ncbi:MAG TPA: tetratricopeptide repeat protein [Bryobacteraceae bacterium]|nr:tetratricopeptide repeat protein [Bryobacteraceae bacterium]